MVFRLDVGGLCLAFKGVWVDVKAVWLIKAAMFATLLSQGRTIGNALKGAAPHLGLFLGMRTSFG